MRPLRIVLVGDYDPEVTAHRAIPVAIEVESSRLGVEANVSWAPTETLEEGDAYLPDGIVGRADGVWCVPASPYRSTAGALSAIRFARENRVPFLGTCGGFQHAVLEFVRSVLGWEDAAHAEVEPDAARPVIVPLGCSLVDESGRVRLIEGTRIAAAYGVEWITEEYRCRYGMAHGVEQSIVAAGMRISAMDEQGEIRAIELVQHPFFVATLFQHERAALKGLPVPLVRSFIETALNLACISNRS